MSAYIWPANLGPAPACIKCGHAPMRPGPVTMSGPAFDLRITVSMHGLRCDACGFQTIRGRQIPDFMDRVLQAARWAWGDRLQAVLVARRRFLGRLARARTRASRGSPKKRS